ncbi:nitrogen fixation protein NifQ [Pseudaeromonas sharmana]|uniref:Nitrogen fixation protein NifQ n=1 Tax=Pseudaeromonas sharmana TaxID=328412 RepID=A0ABV8CJD7_9GAMM
MYQYAMSQDASVAQEWLPDTRWEYCDVEITTPRRWLYHLLQLFMQGKGRLPEAMGLPMESYIQLCDEAAIVAHGDESLLERRQLISSLLACRQHECADLQRWLQQYVAVEVPEMAGIIATASMGFNHLWEDLGLDSRARLRELIHCCFPALITMNVDNLRWKKFFYRQLCQTQGGYVCRAPSCHACYERSNCMEPVDEVS